VRSWLAGPEQGAFYGQSVVDQRHALRVAHLLLARGHSDRLLIRAALLHDVGKSDRGVRLIHRVGWVLAGRVSGRLQAHLARLGGGWRALADHAPVGASRLRAAGVESRLVALVGGRPLPGDEPRLELLAAADEAV
jgi:hypothetical protein